MSIVKRERINTIDYEDKDRTYVNVLGYGFKIIGKRTDRKINNNGNKSWRTKYLVEFIETGTNKWCDSKEIRTGSIKDDAAPYVCGVGIVGLEIDRPQSHYLYDRWRDMLRRCYEEGSNMYYSYGACGVEVCDEWKYFPNYVRDIEQMDNYQFLKITHGGWQIDKDIIKRGNKLYCREYCSIVRIEDNIRERNSRVGNPAKYHRKPVYMFDIYGNFISEFKSNSEAAKYISKRKIPNTSQISICCNKLNNFHTYYGYLFLHKEDFNSIDEATAHILNLINTNKDSLGYKKALRKVCG